MKSRSQNPGPINATSSGRSPDSNATSDNMIFTGLVLNDMGGAVMTLEYNMAGTLRAQTKHHEQIVLFERNGNVHVL